MKNGVFEMFGPIDAFGKELIGNSFVQ